MNRPRPFVIQAADDELTLWFLEFEIATVLMNDDSALPALYHVRPEPRHELGAEVAEIEPSLF